ncbi:hypothetical protein [Streptomyces sp. NPDC004050]
MTSTPRTPHRPSGGTGGRTDLGRRLAARREALGLSGAELGRQCGAGRGLLGTHGVGRIAVSTAVTARAAGTEAAFEIDQTDDVTSEGRSVLAVGALVAVTDAAELRHLGAAARSQPWVGGERTHWMRLTPVRLTGRRVVHG